MDEFRDKVVVVTGAGKGIGRSTAEHFWKLGAKVIMTDVDAPALEDARNALDPSGTRLETHEMDVSDEDQVDDLFTTLLKGHDAVDIVVNNAGIAIFKPLVEHSADDWHRVMSVNLDGVFYCSRAALRAMPDGRGGGIVNIASIAAFHYTTEHVSYAASKAAVVAFTRDLAYEAGPRGVRVNAVAPGPIRTPLTATQLTEEAVAAYDRVLRLGRWGEPEDIAQAVSFLASSAASFITGVTLPVAGGSDLRVV